MLTVFGIKNCDKVKKIISELKESGIAFELYDFKKSAPTENHINRWSKFLGELPVNRRGTTYRKLKDDFESLSDQEKLYFVCEHSSMIKRPIVEFKQQVILIGHDSTSIERIKQKI